MAEMPLLFYPPLDVIHMLHQKFCCQQWLLDPLIMVILIDHNNWHHIAFGWERQQLTEISCSNLFTAAMSTRHDVPLGILISLPSLPGMVMAELQGTHIGWLVLPIQTLPNSSSSLMKK